MSGWKQVLAAVLPLLAAVFLMALGNGLFGTLLAVRMDIDGVGVGTIGIVLGCYSVGYIAGARVGPMIVRRVGHIRAFAAFAAVASAAPILHAMFGATVVWALLRVLTGFCMACLYTTTENWLNVVATNAVRGLVLSAYLTVNYLAYGLSQYLLTLTDPAAFTLFGLVAILVALSQVPLSLAKVEAPRPVTPVPLSLVRLMRISPLGVAGCFGAGLINGAFGSIGPVYAHALDPTTSWVARFMMIAIFAGFLLQVPMGRLSDRFDRRTVFLGQTVVITVVAAALALVGQHSMIATMVLTAFYGGIAYAIYPVALAHANDFMAPGEMAPAGAGLLLMYGVGAVIGPVVASRIMALIGPAGLFAHVALVGAALSAFSLYRMTRRAARPLAEQGAFVSVPQTTPELVGLDPRSPEAPDAA